MNELKTAFFLYFFLLLIAAGFGISAALAFPQYKNYAISAAFFAHSSLISYLFWQFVREKYPKKQNGGEA
ncbi:hypothetical protein WCX72_09925 [Sulfurimonas sp. HSL1-6]|uniref:hypothetical protein n=1 Tax=Thiomicrolovo immobilis TaxID=3131935 RepID=UPI0031F85D3F